MENGKLFLEYLRVLVWPIVVTGCLLVFRNEVGTLLGRVQTADLPGFSLAFDQEIQAAKDLSQRVETQIANTPAPGKKPIIPLTETNARMLELGLRPLPSGLDMSYFRNLAAENPSLALAALRIEVDILARNLAQGFKVDIDSGDSGLTLLRKLRGSGAITGEQLQLAQRVMELSDAAIRGRDVSLGEANDVIDVAQVLADQYLRWLSWGFSEKTASVQTGEASVQTGEVQPETGKTLYVGNLPYATDEAELQKLFARAGGVESVQVMRDTATQRTRGFAFVKMTTAKAARRAIELLDQQELGGRRLTVKDARP